MQQGLFGFSFVKKDNKELISPVPPNNEDSVSIVGTGNFYTQNISAISTDAYSIETSLINKYREIALLPEIDTAIDEVINEAIASDLPYSPVKIDLTTTEFSDIVKEKIRKEFKYVLSLLNFDKRCHTIFRKWYIDGKIAYNKVIDLDNPQIGIIEVRNIDPTRLKFIRKLKGRKKQTVQNIIDYGDYEEYFEYYPNDIDGQQKKGGIRLSKDSVTYITSGLIDNNNKVNISYLHKAVKPINQLKMMEDSLVIYRISRSPERRIFYIDTGNLPPLKAQQRLKEFQDTFRNKLIYDAQTGEIRDDRRFTSMLEDYWFSRSEGGRSTEVQTLPGGCLAMDTKVPLLDGRVLSISEIEAELKTGKELFTYSCNPLTGEIKLGLISWAGVTQKSAKVMKITLDNGEFIICTLDHRHVSRENGFVEAKDLKISDSLMPFYKEDNLIFDVQLQKWVSVTKEKIQYIISGEENKVLITNIEFLNDEIEVGTLTIDVEEKYHSYHTFALSCGIFTKNSNLDNIKDIEYFQKRLYRALNVPIDRLESGNTFADDPGKTSITRDEIKFTKFIGRLRKRFSELLHDILKTQLILKNIITLEDWESQQENIQYDFIYDNHFNELKKLEILQSRLNAVVACQPYIGTLFSWKYIKKYVMHLTDEEILEIDEQIINEIAKDLILDPRLNIRLQSMPLEQTAIDPDDKNSNSKSLPPSDKDTDSDVVPVNKNTVDINKNEIDRKFIKQFGKRRKNNDS